MSNILCALEMVLCCNDGVGVRNRVVSVLLEQSVINDGYRVLLS